MNNLSLILKSIESWNSLVTNKIDNNNSTIFQDIINLTNINGYIEPDNMNNIIEEEGGNFFSNNKDLNNEENSNSKEIKEIDSLDNFS